MSEPIDDLTILRQQAELIRSSGILGQSRLLRLFNFLVECTAAGTAPKEAVIAADVFGKTTGFDVSQDSIVRVYIHNLRRKLDQYYSAAGKAEPARLVLPKGEYRLAVARLELSPAAQDSESEHGSHRGTRVGIALALAALVCIALWGVAHVYWPRSPMQVVRSSAAWTRLLQNDKPTVVVIGDYYIFGDTEQTTDVKRLIREFSINSKDDLDQFLQQHPDQADHFMDVGLGYLPTSSAFALADIMPVLASGETGRVRVMLMSALNPGDIKSANIVYIGLMSGLGTLQRLVFAGSRFRVGESYDELIDQKTNHHYFSTASQYAGEPKAAGTQFGYHDYGFFSTFSGLGGNQIVVIAGTQDEGLREMADVVTEPARLKELDNQAAGKKDFEALYEVLGMDSLDLNGKLIVISPLNPNTIWSPR